jgi:hypothetical protein
MVSYAAIDIGAVNADAHGVIQNHIYIHIYILANTESLFEKS